MKTLLIVLSLSLFLGFISAEVKAQSYESERLLLDAEKLAQMKNILSDMKDGYEILTQGYEMVKNIAQGNFNLHQVFLDNLLKVSPVVSNYKKVADIISGQLQLVKEYKTAFTRFKQDNNFSVQEITYIGNVYNTLLNSSLGNLGDLTDIITEGFLRMNDDERLDRIDGLYKDMQEKLTFLRHFNNHTAVLSLQRLKERNDISILQKLYQLK